MAEPLYFAQMTDAHVGPLGLNPKEAEFNLRWALDEIAGLPAQVRAVIATGDCVSAGKREELEVFAEIASASKVPVYALPANHDLWGEPDDRVWTGLVGPLRQAIDLGTLKSA